MSDKFSLMPALFMNCPFFAAKKQVGCRDVKQQMLARNWRVGLSLSNKPLPALDVRHLTVVACLLSDYGRNPLGLNSDANVSLSWICRSIYGTYGGAEIRRVFKLIEELCYTYIRNQGEGVMFPILSAPAVIEKGRKKSQDDGTEKGKRFELSDLKFHPKFVKFMKDEQADKRVQLFKFDTFLEMNSNLAKAAYAYLPSRIEKHMKQNCGEAWTIGLTTFLKHVGATIPKAKSERRRLFVRSQRGKPSVIDQLNGAALWKGRLKVGLQETKDGKDFKLVLLIENLKVAKWKSKERETRLYQAWMLKFGHQGENGYFNRIEKRKCLTSYERSLLKKWGVIMKGNTPFFEKCKALYGPIEFERMLSNGVGNDAKSATACMIHNLLNGL